MFVTFWNMIWLEPLTKFCQIGSATSELPWMKWYVQSTFIGAT